MRATLEVVEKGEGTNAPKRLVYRSLLPLGGSFVLKLVQVTGRSPLLFSLATKCVWKKLETVFFFL